MEGRCAACYWWTRASARWGRCDLAETGGGDARHAGSRAFAVAPQRARARLVTTPDFGCVQWRAILPGHPEPEPDPDIDPALGDAGWELTPGRGIVRVTDRDHLDMGVTFEAAGDDGAPGDTIRLR